MAQTLKCLASNTGTQGSILGQGTVIPYAAQCSQKQKERHNYDLQDSYCWLRVMGKQPDELMTGEMASDSFVEEV